MTGSTVFRQLQQELSVTNLEILGIKDAVADLQAKLSKLTSLVRVFVNKLPDSPLPSSASVTHVSFPSTLGAPPDPVLEPPLLCVPRARTPPHLDEILGQEDSPKAVVGSVSESEIATPKFCLFAQMPTRKLEFLGAHDLFDEMPLSMNHKVCSVPSNFQLLLLPRDCHEVIKCPTGIGTLFYHHPMFGYGLNDNRDSKLMEGMYMALFLLDQSPIRLLHRTQQPCFQLGAFIVLCGASHFISVRRILMEKVRVIQEVEKYFDSIPDNWRTPRVHDALLNCYVEKRCVDKAEIEMQKFRELGSVNTLQHNTMLRFYFKMDVYKKIDPLVQEMERGIDPDAYTYHIRLNACTASSSLESMEKILMKMEIDPLITMKWNSYVIVAKGYLKANLTERATVILKKAEHCINFLIRKLVYATILSLHAAAGNKDEVYGIWKLYINYVEFYNKGYLIMINPLLRMDDIDGAEALVNSLMESGKEPQASTWGILSTGYSFGSQMEKAVEMLKTAMLATGAQQNIPNMFTMDAGHEYLKEKKDMEAWEELLRLLRQRFQVNFADYNELVGHVPHIGTPSSTVGEDDQVRDDGVDLVGEIEREIEREIRGDDPSDPTIITDNVKDLAGIGFDLLGSSVESSCAAPILASISSLGINHEFTAMFYPLIVSYVGIPVRPITTLFAIDFFETQAMKEIEPTLKTQLIISTVLMTLRITIVNWIALPSSFTIFNFGTQKVVMTWERYRCVGIGLGAGLPIHFVTEYTSIIIPIFAIATSLLVSFSLTAMHPNAFAATGNPTAALGKRFAIGSVALLSLALLFAYMRRACIPTADGLTPKVFLGLLVGALFPYWFSAMKMKGLGNSTQKMVTVQHNRLVDNEGRWTNFRILSKPGYGFSQRLHLTDIVQPTLLAFGECLIAITPILALRVEFATHRVHLSGQGTNWVSFDFIVLLLEDSVKCGIFINYYSWRFQFAHTVRVACSWSDRAYSPF